MRSAPRFSDGSNKMAIWVTLTQEQLEYADMISILHVYDAILFVL